MQDAATLPEAHTDDSPDRQTSVGFCRCCQKNGEVKCQHCGSQQIQIDEPETNNGLIVSRIRQLLIHAQAQKNSKFYIGIILIATGDPAAEGTSMTQYAKHWKVGKAHVSALCVKVCSYLGIQPSQSMRSESSKISFKKSNIRKPKQIP